MIKYFVLCILPYRVPFSGHLIPHFRSPWCPRTFHGILPWPHVDIHKPVTEFPSKLSNRVSTCFGNVIPRNRSWMKFCTWLSMNHCWISPIIFRLIEKIQVFRPWSSFRTCSPSPAGCKRLYLLVGVHLTHSLVTQRHQILVYVHQNHLSAATWSPQVRHDWNLVQTVPWGVTLYESTQRCFSYYCVDFFLVCQRPLVAVFCSQSVGTSKLEPLNYSQSTHSPETRLQHSSLLKKWICLSWGMSVRNAVIEYKFALAHPSLNTWPMNFKYMEALHGASLYVYWNLVISCPSVFLVDSWSRTTPLEEGVEHVL